jgi:hypothetical protein
MDSRTGGGLNKIPNGRRLPVGGRSIDQLGHLLTPLVHWKCTQIGRKLIFSRIILRTTREQIARYWRYIEES